MKPRDVFDTNESTRNEKIDDEESEDDDDSCLIEKEFTRSTTCHGVSFWCSSTHSLQRLFWILVVVGMVAAMVSQVYIRVATYYEYKASTDISSEFLQSIEFPAVTICNYNRFFSPESPEELAAMLTLNAIASSKEVNGENHTLNLTPLRYFDNIPNFTVSNYFAMKGYGFRPTFEFSFCKFRLESCYPVDFKPVITRSGKCYTFNADDNTTLKQTIAGTGNGLFLILNTRHWWYTEAFEGKQEAGIKFQVHSKDIPPQVDKFGIAVPIGRKAYAVVSRKDSHIMHEPWGKCDPENEKTLTFFPKYSLQACMRECLTQQVIDQCGCRTFDQYWAAGSAPECSPYQMANCSSPLLATLEQDLIPEDCSCTIPCSFSEYPVKTSYSKFPNIRTTEAYGSFFNFSSEFVNENFVSIDIYFENIGFTKESQSKQVDESSLLSDIGGQLGLWIGMSLVTVVEFLQYFLMRSCACAKMPAKKSKKKDKSPTVLELRNDNVQNRLPRDSPTLQTHIYANATRS